ncbi:hypothetical protein PHYPSEUDO_011168 [Phytophthora pseudosyringae]|uniref:Uncharacterized protein n=1 Tax=Phytophthora pseudosyringae TaxID=221518 RepID=A0A8T1V9N0_9STRA|nr:hypothetical protein PHYPSEUDO_011168 [Phytophthora pseudosyringae]
MATVAASRKAGRETEVAALANTSLAPRLYTAPGNGFDAACASTIKRGAISFTPDGARWLGDWRELGRSSICVRHTHELRTVTPHRMSYYVVSEDSCIGPRYSIGGGQE